MSREQTIRDIAYAIWQSEGRPDGRAELHWRMAEEHLARLVLLEPRGSNDGKAGPDVTVADRREIFHVAGPPLQQILSSGGTVDIEILGG